MLKIERANFGLVRQALTDAFRTTKPFHRGNWQGLDISNKPEMAVHELRHVSIAVDLRGFTDLEWYRDQLSPNTPWADNHFEERVCGAPINPGVEWAHWPWGQSADKFREKGGIFNHNYMERFWPRYAGRVDMPTRTSAEFYSLLGDHPVERRGIRERYGDLSDVITKLVREPTTRQAILPIYFPEDTAVIEGRQPCTMYYHFVMDDNKRMDLVYPMRSCDFIRHWADDVYMAIRLLLWVISEARRGNHYFLDVRPGQFVMHIANLHMFRNDHLKVFGGPR